MEKFRDGFFPFSGTEVKEYFEDLKKRFSPDIVLTHYRDDRHQDHRLVSDLAWNTFRGELILEYEIPKYDGDLGQPNLFMPLSEAVCRKKVQTFWTCTRLKRRSTGSPKILFGPFFGCAAWSPAGQKNMRKPSTAGK